MPFIQHTNVSENTILALWKIEESKEQLFTMLNNRVSDQGVNLSSNNHWLASRLLLKELYPDQSVELYKDEFNKPYLRIDGNEYHLSITHSFEYAAVLINPSHNVGVDLEKIDGRVLRVSHKFIRADEQVEAGDLLAIYYTVIWSAKETLYKFYGKKNLDFKQHLRIGRFSYSKDAFTIKGYIEKEEYKRELDILVTTMNGYILTCIP